MNRAKIAIPIVVVVVVVAVAAFVVLRPRGDKTDALTASGTVETTEADLGFQVGGRVIDVKVHEGDAVTLGQELARIDVADLEARRSAAEAQVAAAEALLAELRQGARPAERMQAGAVIDAARERAEEAARESERARKLFEGGAISREARDQAATAHQVARAQLDQARQQGSIVDQGPRAERIAAQQAVVRQAKAAVDQVSANLDQAIIRAPFAGVVTVKHREAGETVSPGLPVVTVMNASDRWVRIYIHEDVIGRVHIGQTATIRTDTDPDHAYTGRVTFIGSQAEFTPRNVQTSEQRVKLVYAVKVAITGDPRGDLKSGVPADVTIDTRAAAVR